MCAGPARRGGKAASGAAMTDLAREYAARAAIFRRLARELRNEEDRAALDAIAADYEARAERLSRRR